MQYTQKATGHFPTLKASAYLQQLCKHFAHKIAVTFDATSAQAALPTGPCIMAASDHSLRISLAAATLEDMERAKTIIDTHLERFAFREGFKTMDWE